MTVGLAHPASFWQHHLVVLRRNRGKNVIFRRTKRRAFQKAPGQHGRRHGPTTVTDNRIMVFPLMYLWVIVSRSIDEQSGSVGAGAKGEEAQEVLTKNQEKLTRGKKV